MHGKKLAQGYEILFRCKNEEKERLHETIHSFK
jgi:hypothetical protein